MKQGSPVWPRLVAFGLLFAAAGCGSVASQGTGAAPSGNGTPSSATGTPLAGTATGTATGAVVLTLSAQHYTPESPLLVTIHNGLTVSIWFQSPTTGCGSVSVERMDNGAWVQTGNCAPSGASRMAQLAASDSVVVRIDFAQGVATGQGWPSGTYRVMLHYSLSATATAGGSGSQSQSDTFTVS